MHRGILIDFKTHISWAVDIVNNKSKGQVMALIECSECKKEISDKADKCPHCGAPTSRVEFKRQKKWHEKTSVTLFVAAILIVIGFGFIHVITGSNLSIPNVVIKDSFGYSETFINVDKVTGMPWVAAKSKYPIGCKVLQEKGYIESDEAFQKRVQGEFEKEVEKAQEEFQKELEKM